MPTERDVEKLDQVATWLDTFGAGPREVDHENMIIDLGNVNSQDRFMVLGVWEDHGYTIETPDFVDVSPAPEMSILAAMNYVNSSIFGVKLIYNRDQKTVTSKIDVLCGRLNKNKLGETLINAVTQAEFAEEEFIDRLNAML